MVRQRTLTPSFGGSNPPSPGKKDPGTLSTGIFAVQKLNRFRFLDKIFPLLKQLK